MDIRSWGSGERSRIKIHFGNQEYLGGSRSHLSGEPTHKEQKTEYSEPAGEEEGEAALGKQELADVSIHGEQSRSVVVLRGKTSKE